MAGNESVAAIGGLWRLLAARCVSSPDALLAARWKLPQLRVAARFGLLVPDTIVTTDHAAAETFRRAGRVVIKAVQDARVMDQSRERFGYTRELDRGEDLRGIAVAPVLLQRLVDKVADIRVTMIGTDAFAARISVPSGGPLDFRQASTHDTHIEPFALQKPIAARCVRFLRRYGLRFGAFDFAEDGEGRLWFLECNANGQWAWLERATGQPMTARLLDELLADPP